MDATTFLLTYPQSDFVHDELYAFLQSIKPVVWARVARETHEDGQPHFHVGIRFGARVKTRSDNRIFDFNGRHPNIEVTRSVKSMLQYCAKEGNYKDYGKLPGSSSLYDECVAAAKAGDVDLLNKLLLEAGKSTGWADRLWARHSVPDRDIQQPGEGTMCVQLQGLSFSGKSTLLVGPSGCGKSTWAKLHAPKPALWVTHMDDLKKLNNGHKSIIFDDMDFSMLPRSTQIYIVDQDDIRTIHCRHTNATIPKGMPKIFTCNPEKYPFTQGDEAIHRRLQVIRIQSWAI